MNAIVVGNRPLVRQLVATVQAHHGGVEAASAQLQLPSVVRSAIAYHATFRDAVDYDARWASRIETGSDSAGAGVRRNRVKLVVDHHCTPDFQED